MFWHGYFLNDYKFVVSRRESLEDLAVSAFSKFFAHLDELEHFAFLGLSDHVIFEVDVSEGLVALH